MTRAVLARLTLLLLMAVSLSGCAIAGGIFKAGMWVGIIVVVVILAVIAWIVSKARG